MSLHSSLRAILLAVAFVASAFAQLHAAPASSRPALVDDFSNPTHTISGVARFLVDDQTLGSHSHATQEVASGILKVEGELVPGRGVPAFISVPLPLASDGKPQDLSAFQGVRVRVKLGKGNLCIQISSTDVQNFDYHTSAPLVREGDSFQEVKIPFTELRRAWSEQTPLNPKTITSVNLVSIGMSKDTFAYQVAEVSFY